MSDNRRVHKNDVSNQGASLLLINKRKNQMVSVSKSASYPYRPGEPDCSYYLRTGSCGYGSNCRFNHPVYGAQYSLKTGTCKYGSTSKYHPKHKNGAGPVTFNSLGLPMRQEEKSCPHYMRTGSCKYGVACKFHHPQPANGPGGSSGVRYTGGRSLPKAPYASGSRLQIQSYIPLVVSNSQNTNPATYVDEIKVEQSEFRGWDELIPEALELIFSNLSLKELLTVIPCVCKSWRNVVTAPDYWQEIDIEQWSKRCKSRHVDRMVRMLIIRSSGSLRKLSVSGLQKDATFSFITKNAGSLQALRLPNSEMTDSVVEQTAKRFSTITLLDLSYCCKIGSKALEAIGKHCKLLVTLCRNIESMELEVDEPSDAEANAIAATMPRLKHLEMGYHEISTGCVMNILSGCHELELLDIRGCCDVELDNEFLKNKFPKLKVLGPFVMEDFDDCEWDDFTDSDYDPWDPDYIDYDDYTDPWHPDYHDNYEDYAFFWEDFIG